MIASAPPSSTAIDAARYDIRFVPSTRAWPPGPRLRAPTRCQRGIDDGPIISATPGLPGLFHAVTYNGWTLGPVVGRLVAEAALGRGGRLPAAFSLERFG